TFLEKSFSPKPPFPKIFAVEVERRLGRGWCNTCEKKELIPSFRGSVAGCTNLKLFEILE
ncbi:MAG: hypothetical protein LBR56_05540, partial [Sporomusaceae bacterium]|nr:hypothetical protein [Sporomusaceae bacterium]